MEQKGLLLDLEAVLKTAHFTQEHLDIIKLVLGIHNPKALDALRILTKSFHKRERLEMLRRNAEANTR